MQQLTNGTLLQGGKYKIERVLGQGGFGITYLASQIVTIEGPLGKIDADIKVCIKEFFMKDLCNRDNNSTIVSVPSTGSKELVTKFQQKFMKEALNISKLQHPNIIKVTDIFEENGTAYYVMEYTERGSLAEKVKKHGFLSEQRATRYILRVANALQYIHERKMNHLDVKPSNILINENDEPILIDFGLSKQYDATTGSQTSSTPMGISEGYAPMEQYKQGGVGEFSPETDIYALGATYFKLLTGQTPPSALDVSEDDIPVGELKSRGISQKVIDVISKAMQSRKKDRYKTIDELVEALKQQKELVNKSVGDNETTRLNAIGVGELVEALKHHKELTIKSVGDDETTRLLEETELNTKIQSTVRVQKVEDKTKLGFWLWVFLVTLCLGGAVDLISALESYRHANSDFDSVLIPAIYVVLCCMVYKSFRNRDEDAVILGKTAVVVALITSILVMFMGGDEEGLYSFPRIARSAINCVVWFLYLSISKKVEEVIPKETRETKKRDYVICGAIVIAFIISMIAGYIDENSYLEIDPTYSGKVENKKSYDADSLDFIYSGNVVNGKPNGVGYGVYSYGYYSGEYVNGLRSGKGEFMSADSTYVLEGIFLNDQFQEGKFMNSDRYFEGTFNDDQPYNGRWYRLDGEFLCRIKNGAVVQNKTKPQQQELQQIKKDDGCEKKIAAFESYAARLADAKARKAQGPAAIKEYAALVKEAPTQKANVESCKTNDALKKRIATALLKINASMQ